MKGILLYNGNDEVIEKRATAFRLQLGKVDFPPHELPYDKTLIVQAGTRVPWDLLPAAWNFLERWDAAVPLWRYGVLAADVGTPEERKKTQAIVRDLRVLLHSYELLFVRRSADGTRFIELWARECSGGCDKRLAFLRAFYQVKPRMCVLPTSWLAEVRAKSKQAMAKGRVVTQGHVATQRRSETKTAGNLVRLEIQPGRFVKVLAGTEAEVLAKFAKLPRGR
jgi:hypothetical protein